MKKLINRFSKTAAAIVCATAIVLSVSGCDMLQGMLSSEQEEELEEATGAASVSGTTWYYNGTSTTDISATTNNTLCINFGKKAALSTSGLAGSFTITYTDANSNAATRSEERRVGKECRSRWSP